MTNSENKDLEVLLNDLGFPIDKLHKFVVDGMSEGIWVTNAEGNTVYANSNFSKMLKTPLNELSQKHLVEVILFDDKTPAEMFLSPTTLDAQRRVDIQLCQKGGTALWVMMGMNPMFGKRSEFLGSIFMVMDISEIKSAELALKKNRDQLFETSKLASLGEMSAGMAHEMNQPMAGITLAVATIKKLKEKNLLTDAELESALTDILASVKRCTKVINHVRAFARQETQNFALINVNETLSSALMLMKQSLKLSGIEVVQDLSVVLPEISGEPFQLEQVWINSLSNAKDALDERALASGDVHYRKRLAITSKVEGDTVLVEFTDNGIGMSEAVRKKIFQPFFTTKAPGKGTGLGMSIVHGILESHKASIEVKSQPKKGTTFSIRLPVPTSK